MGTGLPRLKDFKTEEEWLNSPEVQAKFQRMDAFHEAGHAVMARAVGVWEIYAITVVPGPTYSGRCWLGAGAMRLTPEDHRRGVLIDMAGIAAHDILFKEPMPPSEWILDMDEIPTDYTSALNSARVLHPHRPEHFVDLMTALAVRTLRRCWPAVERLAEVLVNEKTIDDSERIDDIIDGRAGRQGKVRRLHDAWMSGRGRRFQAWMESSGGVVAA